MESIRSRWMIDEVFLNSMFSLPARKANEWVVVNGPEIMTRTIFSKLQHQEASMRATTVINHMESSAIKSHRRHRAIDNIEI